MCVACQRGLRDCACAQLRGNIVLTQRTPWPWGSTMVASCYMSASLHLGLLESHLSAQKPPKAQIQKKADDRCFEMAQSEPRFISCLKPVEWLERAVQKRCPHNLMNLEHFFKGRSGMTWAGTLLPRKTSKRCFKNVLVRRSAHLCNQVVSFSIFPLKYFDLILNSVGSKITLKVEKDPTRFYLGFGILFLFFFLTKASNSRSSCSVDTGFSTGQH